MAPLVKPEYGPTLRQILAPRSWVLRAGVLVLVLAIAVAAIDAALQVHAGERTALVRKPVTFNLAYGGQFKRTSVPGRLLSLEHRRAGLFLDSFVVRSLVLAPYRGSVSGILPTYAFDYINRLRRRYAGFELIEEGRARVNNAIGYQVIFRAKLGDRTLYGRHVMLFAPAPDGVRQGLLLEIASTPAAGTPAVESVGLVGALKTPFRSFRLGTDRSGGQA